MRVIILLVKFLLEMVYGSAVDRHLITNFFEVTKSHPRSVHMY